MYIPSAATNNYLDTLLSTIDLKLTLANGQPLPLSWTISVQVPTICSCLSIKSIALNFADPILLWECDLNTDPAPLRYALILLPINRRSDITRNESEKIKKWQKF